MTKNSALPDLAHCLGRLLETVKEACGVEVRRGWLAGPMALLIWVRTRRERKERAAALEAFKALLEEFLAVLKEVAAGTIPAEPEPEVAQEQPTDGVAAMRVSTCFAVAPIGEFANIGVVHMTARWIPACGVVVQFPRHSFGEHSCAPRLDSGLRRNDGFSYWPNLFRHSGEGQKPVVTPEERHRSRKTARLAREAGFRFKNEGLDAVSPLVHFVTISKQYDRKKPAQRATARRSAP
jgi:hypothetical protein